MSSTELLDAASISTTSSDVAAAIARQDSQTPHGVTVGPPFGSSATPRGSSPSTSCRSRASRRTGTRGGRGPARSRCAACGRRAPARRRLRTCGGDDGGTAKRPRDALSLVARPAASPCARRSLIPLGALLACALDRRRLPQLRHRLQPALGQRSGARPPARLRRPARPHAAPAGDARRRDPDAARRRRADRLGRARVPRARRARLADLRARRALVRPRGRRRRRAADPHPHPGAELRRARVRRHPVRRARARRDPRRGAPAARRRCSLLALAGLLRPEAWLFALAYVAWRRDAAAARRSRSPRPCSGCSTTCCSPATRCTR